jgi:predicted pyridoxine 5'-phosphate oxidase superfamily flavin-nucleotide-binding protein
VAPGAQDLQNAVPIPLTDLAVGDRILARGRAGDGGAFAATSIVVMSKEDLARKHAAERADWEKRGTGGVITALDPGSREITITATGAKPRVVAFAPGAVLRRYASGSVKFSDAAPSRLEELKVGDQVKARGTGSEDGSRFVAEELVSGSFRTIAASVVTVDAGQGTLQITDLATNKRVQAALTADSTVRRLSAEVVKMLAARLEGTAAGSSSGEIQSAIEKLPRLGIADLKAGDAIILTCTNGDDPSRATAITLLAGAEPLLKSKGGKAADLGSWNLDLNMGIGLP